MSISDEKVNNEFLTQEKFMAIIERLVIDKQVNHMTAILLFCEQNFIDVEDVISLISRPMKEKIKVDAIGAGFLKTEGNTLPI